MMADFCSTVMLKDVVVQENGIIRNSRGYIIARLVDGVDFKSKHVQNVAEKEQKS